MSLKRTIVIFIIVFSFMLPAATQAQSNTVPPDSPMGQMLLCESGNHGKYQTNTGNGFYGGYQFTISTWNWVASIHLPQYVGTRPDLAPPRIQDRMAFELLFNTDGGGWTHWPICGQNVAGLSETQVGFNRKPVESTGSFGRATDIKLECEVDSLPGTERVAIRGNIVFVDLNHRGGEGERKFAFGRASDLFGCEDFIGNGIDLLYVIRDGVLYWNDWTGGIGNVFS